VTTSSNRREPLFDIHPVTGASIEVFWADSTLASVGKGGVGWFWWPRRRGFAPDGMARGPFPTSYSAYRDALQRPIDPPQFGRTIARFSIRR
jgi:hypothetical protein